MKNQELRKLGEKRLGRALALSTLGALALLIATGQGCGFEDDDVCRQNVDGCQPGHYSCDDAAICYATEGRCISSGECDTDESYTPPPSENDPCRQGVSGCSEGWWSCGYTDTCWEVQAGCLDSGECDSGGGSSCSEAGSACDSNGSCCSGVCVGNDDLCADTCTYDDECNSGCCRPLESGGGACGPC